MQVVKTIETIKTVRITISTVTPLHRSFNQRIVITKWLIQDIRMLFLAVRVSKLSNRTLWLCCHRFKRTQLSRARSLTSLSLMAARRSHPRPWAIMWREAREARSIIRSTTRLTWLLSLLKTLLKTICRYPGKRLLDKISTPKILPFKLIRTTTWLMVIIVSVDQLLIWRLWILCRQTTPTEKNLNHRSSRCSDR